MIPLTRRATLPLGLLAFAATGAMAQPANIRVRGTITALEGDMLAVTTREGDRVLIRLVENATIVSLRRVALTEIAQGTSLGVVAEPGPNGGLQAVAITVLPPGVRITERQFDWDLRPGTSMNDGPVAAIMEQGTGRDVTLSIMGRSVPVHVPAETPLLMPVPASRADLVPNATVFLNALRAEDGRLSANRITVSKDGVAPVI
ncbi:hypothetical protein [Roseococcus sp. YIM B11640]|uniref:hypothetical protein n=1 Tax=Roseococcus sp. YIM B11640 TaxID=3133973 RepID=UPI003C7A11A6